MSGTLGRYRVLDTLGRGGMGVVLRGYDEELDRLVALKVLHTDVGPRSTVRLRREAQALAKLSHPNVVQVYEIGRIDGRTFVAMELVEGQTLTEWMQSPHDWRSCVELFLQLGAGLAAAHEQGLVHRDFKPGNAIIDDAGRPRVLDFGLARHVEGSGVGVSWSESGALDEPSGSVLQPRVEDPDPTPPSPSLTETGAILGTPAYMPLEQIDGKDVDARSDQFSFCVVLYEAIYGQRPYEGHSISALAVAMRKGEMRSPPRGVRAPERLLEALLRGLELQPDRRWPSMDALLAELRRLVAPRRRGGLALAAAVGLVGAGLAVWRGEAQPEPCTGAAAEIEEIWNDDRRARVGGAISGTGVSYAEDTWRRVERALDDYAQEWTSSHTTICEATAVHQEQSAEVMDLRMACLWRRKIALRDAVEVLLEADETRVSNSVGLVSGLPDLERCDDVGALEAGMQPPSDLATAERVRALRDRLQRSTTLRKAGDYAASLSVADEVRSESEVLAHGPVLAETLARRAEILDDLGRYDEAERDLERALELAAQHRHDAIVAEAASALVWIVGYRLARYDEALGFAKTALALVRGPAIEGRAAEAYVRSNLGTVHLVQGELEPALAEFRRTLELHEQANPPEQLAVAMTLNNIGFALWRKGDLEGASSHHRRSLAIQQEVLGPDHPNIATALINMGNVLKEHGELDDALTRFRRALVILEGALGPEHPNVAGTRNNIGTVLKRQGKLEEALVEHRRALAIWEDALGPDHPQVAMSLNGIGNVLSEQGKHEEALAWYRRALVPLEKALGSESIETSGIRINIGIAYAALGEHEQAMAHLRRALEIQEIGLGPEHANVALTLVDIGRELSGQGKHEEALRQLERALTTLEAAKGTDDPSVAKCLIVMGTTLGRMGEGDEARTRLRRSLALLERALGPDHLDVSEPLLRLGELALDRGDHELARAHAQRALAIRESSEPDAASIAEIQSLLARALWSERTERVRARALAEQARDAFAEGGPGREDDQAEIEQWLATHRAG